MVCTSDCRLRCTTRSEEHTSELQSQFHLVCRLLLEKKKNHTPPVVRPPQHANVSVPHLPRASPAVHDLLVLQSPLSSPCATPLARHALSVALHLSG